MLGVLRRHWKPKRNNSGRKKKDKEKGGTNVDRDLPLSPKESVRNTRPVRDTRQVHPEKDADKINVLGKDCTILVTGQNDFSLVSHNEILKGYCKDPALSPVISLKNEDFNDIKDTGVSKSWENLKDESEDKDAGDKQWRELVDSNIDDRNVYDESRNNDSYLCKDDSLENIETRNCTDKESNTENEDRSESEGEKSDPVKESLEREVADLKLLLEHERTRGIQLQQESSLRGGLKQQLDREKMLRSQAEARLQQMIIESDRCKARLVSLQEDCHKMEDMVRTMLQFRSRIEQLKHEKSSISLTYESKIRKYQTCIASLEKENFILINELTSLEVTNKDLHEERERSLTRILLERLQLLEQENSSLILENEQQRLQYEHCLDDVANQVVHALLAQKTLQEDCGKLQERVQDLEYQNHALTVMIKHRLTQSSVPINQGIKETSYHAWNMPDIKSSETENRDVTILGSMQRLQDHGIREDCSSRQSLHNSPSHTSQSEDSTESLASLCSDYSIHSGSSSSSAMSHPGFPKMSSPPQWIRERASKSRPTALSPSQYATNSSHFHQRSLLHRPRADVLVQCDDQNFSRKDGTSCMFQNEHSEIFRKRSRRCRPCSALLEGQVWPKVQCGILSPTLRESRRTQRVRVHERTRNYGAYTSRDSSTEFGGLDSMETPNEECFSMDGLPVLTSTHRLISSQCSKSSQFAGHSDAWLQPEWTSRSNLNLIKRENNCTTTHPHMRVMDVETHGHLINNTPSQPSIVIPRPTTLNIIPHVLSDPAHNFIFPSLEQKSHVINECGNMYEEIDLPSFPEQNDGTKQEFQKNISDNPIYTLTYQNDEPYYSNIGEEQQISSCEDSEIAMNTVIRKTVQNSNTEIGANSQLEDGQNNQLSTPSHHQNYSDSHCLSETVLPTESLNNNQSVHEIPKDLSIPRESSSLSVGESPLSSGENREHGNKDEGYSTMSSDVQSEVSGGTSFIEPGKQSCASTIINHSPSYLTLESSIPEPVAEADENGMLSSSDSGLGFQKSIRKGKPSSDKMEEETCHGFERDLDSSLIRCEKGGKTSSTDQATVKSLKTSENRRENLSQHDIRNVLSSNDNLPTAESIKDNSHEFNARITSNHSKSMVHHSAYDKIFTLLTPRGYNAHRNNPRRITLPFIKQPDSLCDATYPFKQRIQTAEKATSTEPQSQIQSQGLLRDIFSDSSLSISSSGSVSHIRTVQDILISRDGSYLFKQTGDKTLVQTSNSQGINSSAHYNLMCCKSGESICQSCHLRERRSHSVLGKSTPHCNGIQRAYSDSWLYVKSLGEVQNDLMKSVSSITKHPPLRLNLLPLDHHFSACDLTSPPLTPSSLTPPLRRSQRQMLTGQDYHTKKQRAPSNPPINERLINNTKWPLDRRSSPSMSLSSVHSTSSEENSRMVKSTNFDESSMKCSKDNEISSESGDDYGLMEHHNFVEQWLQREDAEIVPVLHNGYTYDEDEIGNWSFHVSTDEVPPSISEGSWEGQWNPLSDDQSNKSFGNHLKRIQKRRVENEYQDNHWNNALWDRKNNQKSNAWQNVENNTNRNSLVIDKIEVDDATFKKREQSVSETVKTDYLNNTPEPVNGRSSPVGEEVEALLQDWSDLSSRQDSCCDVSVAVSETATCTEELVNVSQNAAEAEDKIIAKCLQSEATEFNRDFYRLCIVGSTRSLSASESSSHLEVDHSQLQSHSSPMNNVQNSPVACREAASKDETKNVYLLKDEEDEQLRCNTFIGVASENALVELSVKAKGENVNQIAEECINIIYDSQSNSVEGGKGDASEILCIEQEFKKCKTKNTASSKEQHPTSDKCTSNAEENNDKSDSISELPQTDQSSVQNQATDSEISEHSTFTYTQEADISSDICSSSKQEPVADLLDLKTSAKSEFQGITFVPSRHSQGKTSKVPPKIPPKRSKTKSSSTGNSSSKSSNMRSSSSHSAVENKRSPTEKTKIPIRNLSPDKKVKSNSRSHKTRSHSDIERRSRAEKKHSLERKSGTKKSNARKSTKDSRRISDNKMVNNDFNAEKGSHHVRRVIKTNNEELTAKKEVTKILTKKSVLQDKAEKSHKLDDLAGKSEKDSLMKDLELRLSSDSSAMSVADKIQELNALIENTDATTIAVLARDNSAAPQETKESCDSSLERRHHNQKKERALSKEGAMKEGCGTSWVHVEADIDLSDPKARANLLDSMMASSSSSSSSSEDEGEDEVLEHKHHQRLHALHRIRRHRKRATDRDAVISFIPRIRATIIDRHDFYYRYGEKEIEAVACFDFLDELSTSPSDAGSSEILGRETNSCITNNNNTIVDGSPDNEHNLQDTNHHINEFNMDFSRTNHSSLPHSSFESQMTEECLSSTTLNSQDGDPVDHISLSDSCAESYSSSTHSLNHIT